MGLSESLFVSYSSQLVPSLPVSRVSVYLERIVQITWPAVKDWDRHRLNQESQR